MRRTIYIIGAGLIAVAGIQAWRGLYPSPAIIAPQHHIPQPVKGFGAIEAHANRVAQNGTNGPVREEVWKLTAPAKTPLATSASGVERFRYLASLKGELNAGEIDEMCRFLEEVPAIEGMSEQLQAFLNNEILNRLAREDGSGARVQTALLKVQANASQTAVMRDYAIQHLGLRYVDGYTDQEASRQAFWERVEENLHTIGATSLLALQRIDEQGLLPPDETQRLISKASEIARSSIAPEPSRMVSLQVLRRKRSAQGLQAAREILESSSTTPLTITAIATIGDLGTPDDVTYLESSPLRADARYAPVMTSALKKLPQHTTN